MRIILNLAGAATMLLALGACGGSEKGAGGLSADEERQLDNAAAMLDDSNNLVLSDDSLTANEGAVAAEENAAEAPVAANSQ